MTEMDNHDSKLERDRLTYRCNQYKEIISSFENSLLTAENAFLVSFEKNEALTATLDALETRVLDSRDQIKELFAFIDRIGNILNIHFCNDWDGLLICQSDSEYKSCTCLAYGKEKP